MQQQRPHGGGGETSPHQSDMSVGDILRRTRLHYDRTIEDIELALRIKASMVEAIENGQFARLPGRVYTIGFIRTYSEYLGLDGDKMVSLYKSQTGVRPGKVELVFPEATVENRFPYAWHTAASLVLAIGVIAIWMSMNGNDRRAVNDIPEVPAAIASESQQVKAPATNVASNEKAGPPIPQRTVQATEPAAGAEKKAGIILKIVQNSWVEIKDKEGNEVVSRVLKAGDKYFVPSRPDLFMSLGNSGGVKIEIAGEDLPNLGSPGQVLRNVPLDIEVLKKKFSR